MEWIDKVYNGFRLVPNHILVALSAWVSRIVVAVSQLVSVRLLIDSLGAEQYAVFALLTGLMGWFMLTDMGIGISLQNYISEQRAKGESYEDYISVASAAAVAFLILMIIVLFYTSPYIATVFLRKFNFMTETEKTYHLFVVGLLFMLSCVGGIAYKIWYATQQGYLANIVPALASLLALFGIWIVGSNGIDSTLFWSLFAYIFPTAFLALISLICQIFFVSKNQVQFSWRILPKILKRAGHFWSFALMAALVLQMDYLVMSQFVEANEIVTYNIATKVFSLLFFVYNSILSALWPVCTEYITQQQWGIVNTYIKKYLVLGLASMAASTGLLVLLMPIIVNIISPVKTVIIPVYFIILLGIYHLIRVWTDTYAMVLQSMSEMKPFWVWVPCQAIVSVSLQWVLAPHYGIYGIVWGLVLSYIITVVWSLPYNLYKCIRLNKDDC